MSYEEIAPGWLIYRWEEDSAQSPILEGPHSAVVSLNNDLTTLTVESCDDTRYVSIPFDVLHTYMDVLTAWKLNRGTENKRVSTIFECRCCGGYVRGTSDGIFFLPGWRRIDGIDGPNAICPACLSKDDSLNHLVEDGYEHVAVKV